MVKQVAGRGDPGRRSFLKLAGTIPMVVGVAGCQGSGDDGDGGSSGDGAGNNGGGGSSGDGAGSAGDGSGGDGDLFPSIHIATSTNRNIADHIRLIAQSWNEDLGLDVDYEVVEFSTHLSQVYGNREYQDMAEVGWTTSPERYDPFFHLGLFTSDHQTNHAFFSDPTYDELFEEYVSTFDQDRRSELVADMQTIHYEQIPSVVYARPRATPAVNTALWDFEPTDLFGVQPTATMSILTAEPKTDETTMVMGDESTFDAPNPLSSQFGSVHMLFTLVYSPFRRIDTNGEIIDWAVREFTEVDSTTIDLTLRDDMAFHDGEPVTVEDLQFSLEFFRDEPLARFQPWLERVDTVAIQDDETVRVNFEQPDSVFGTSGSIFLRILPQHIFEEVRGENDDIATWSADVDELVGSGPFEISEFTPERMVFQATGDHWFTPAFDEIIWIGLGSLEAVRAGLVEGTVHLYSRNLSATPAYTAAEQSEDIEVLETSSLFIHQILWDNRKDIFDDIALRRALRMTIPAEDINEAFLEGVADITDGTPIHPDLPWGRDDLPTLDEIYDPDEARSILEEAGYSWDENGRLRLPS